MLRVRHEGFDTKVQILGRAGFTENLVKDSEKEGEIDRFRQDHLRAGLCDSALGKLGGIDQCGEHEDGNAGEHVVALESCLDIAAVHAGHDDIEENYIREKTLGDRYRFGRVIFDADLVSPPFFEVHFKQLSKPRFVVDQ